MTYSVLIVENELYFRTCFAEAVRGAVDMSLAGVAAEMQQGLRLLEDQRPDVLLVDVRLPGGSGIELIRRANDQMPHCESLVVTVLDDDRTVIECIEAGASGYLLKNARRIDIVQQIRVLREGGSPISPAIARRLLKRLGPTPQPSALEDGVPVSLSAQERSVLSMSAKGYSYDEVACLIGVSRYTVRTYVKRIYRKLQVHTKTEAVYEARKLGLVDD